MLAPIVTVAVIAEKPSVARDLAAVVGARRRGKGFLSGGGYVVTWAVGHLVGLAEPGEIRPEWKRWSREQLPIIPGRWPLVVSEKTADQFKVVSSVLRSPKVKRVVCATDAGREGELIFRYIYEAAGCDKPVSRLWISSLTPEAIREGFDALRPGSELDPLADAARGRSRADWLVGMNLSRALTLACDETFSVGRVQTPTLAMVVERELAIRDFVPEPYREVTAVFGPPGESSPEPAASYTGTWFRGKRMTPESRRLPPKAREVAGKIREGKTVESDEAGSGEAGSDDAGRIVRRVLTGEAKIASVTSRTRRMAPPLLYDLTELQRHANRLYRFSARKTLQLAQKLYQDLKLLTYPRTDSRHLSRAVADTLPERIEALRDRYGELFAPGTGERPPGSQRGGAKGTKRYVDDGKVTDHHAILPTARNPDGLDPRSDLGKIYDLVARRLLATWHGDHVWSVTTVITEVHSKERGEDEGESFLDRFHASGKVVEELGWKAVEVGGGKEKKKRRKKKGDEDPDGEGDGESEDDGDENHQALPAGLTRGAARRVVGAEALDKQTRPPKRFTEATLLTAMETAGKTLDDKRLSEAMRERGLGTPATRAETIETLLKREYILRKGKVLEATDRGVRLIEKVHPEARSPALTGRWEAQLRSIERGDGELSAFMEGIEDFIRRLVGVTLGGNEAPATGKREGNPVNQQEEGERMSSDDQHARPRGGSPSSAPGTTPGTIPGDDLKPPAGRPGGPPSGRGSAGRDGGGPAIRYPDGRPWTGGGAPDRKGRFQGAPSRPPSPQKDLFSGPSSGPAPASPDGPPERLTNRSPERDAGPAPEPPEDYGPQEPPPGYGAGETLDEPGLPEWAVPAGARHGGPSRGPGAAPPSAPAAAAPAKAPTAAKAPTTARADLPPPRRSATPPDRLGGLLRETFGHPSFRPYQEEVCRAVTTGGDALLVMPTGAGKSLCYQLPGIARAGTTLVISPLIALMEDQVAKLQALGLAAERIHSGRGRDASRDVAKAYREGMLDFLFIAPERLSVPGFPQMLARHPPTLVAVDEAHCISHWGHDFRPDYRMIGQHVPNLRPAPVIAMTATATPQVQEDIVGQLSLGRGSRFIHGFRRDNIAVEVVERVPSARRGVVLDLLSDPERRPAIVYAPSRKEADGLGAELAEHFPAASYHAGMMPDDRDRVQADFLGGRLEAIVATIAFGMGVDKPDIRTVVHTGLPGSLEGYYQEIGRAGRDGKPSRAVLLYSWADRRTHEFFFNRNYPDPKLLNRLYRALDQTPRSPESLRLALDDEDPEALDRALEQLWIHGGALLVQDPGVGDAFLRGDSTWRDPYLLQREHKLGQIEDVSRFAQGRSCRMVQLVEHFGDQEDSGRPCGHCDVCHPEGCVVHVFRTPTASEISDLEEILDGVRQRDGMTTGQLYKEFGRNMDRKVFETRIAGLTRAGFLRISEDSFDKDGRTIHFQRAHLTREGHTADSGDLKHVPLPEAPPKSSRSRSKRRSISSSSSKKSTTRPKNLPDAPPELVDELREWRRQAARKRKMPAFRVFSDKTMELLAALRPQTEEALMDVKGIGPATVKKYGEEILGILRRG